MNKAFTAGVSVADGKEIIGGVCIDDLLCAKFLKNEELAKLTKTSKSKTIDIDFILILLI